MTKRDDKRHKFALFMNAHREGWVKVARNYFSIPYKADRKQISYIFRNTNSTDVAQRRIKQYLASKSCHERWFSALKSVQLETGHAAIEVIHEHITGKSKAQRITERSWFPDTSELDNIMVKQDEEVEPVVQNWDDMVSDWLQSKKAFGKITNITDTTNDKIVDILDQGRQDGLSHYDIGKQIDDMLGDSWDGRGETISRTEVNGAMNYAGLQDAKAMAPDLNKVWSTTGADNVRPWHEEADGQSVPQDEPFIVMGEEMDCPGDDAGSPENVINCACCTLFEPPLSDMFNEEQEE
jgi:uncharacterized protein with gpF-like domain